jgi:hypothetical protein
MTSVGTSHAPPSYGTTNPSRPARTPERAAMVVSIALLVVGVALRVHHYLDRRSLWLDEIWVALNIVGRSFVGLARPLDYAQSAPVGFLWLERLAVVLGGVNELALRAVPLLAGCLLLVALWLLARRLLDVRGAALCLAIAVFAPILIYFSNEVKPYVSDALVAVVLTWLALDVLDAPDSRRAWLRLAIGGAGGILLSTPSVFVLAGVGVALIAHPAIRTTRVGWLRLVGTGALWLGLFALGYFTIYQGTANSTYMQSIWSDAFLSLPVGNLLRMANDAARIMWIESFVGDNDKMLPPKAIVSATLLSLGGAVVLWRRHGLPVTLLVALPIVATAGASFARLWPLTPRLLVFLVPTLVLLLGTGLWALAGLLPVRQRGPVLALLGAIVLLPAIITDTRLAREPRRRDDIAPLVREFMTARQGPAIMYVVGHGTPSWLFYTVRWQEREGEAYRVAANRANTSAHFETRECITQEPGLRVVFGPTGKGTLADSALAVESAWLAAQPERDVHVLTLGYEHAAGHVFENQLLAKGATRVAERSRQGAELRHFRFPAHAVAPAPVSCDARLAGPPATTSSH